MIHRTRIVLLGVLGVALLATTAPALAGGYCDPLAGCNSLKLTPSTAARGHVTRVHGTVAGGCQLPGTVTVYSRAFRGVTHHSFAGVPALYIHANGSGGFSMRVRISHHVEAGRYHVGGRCGGGNFGSATLHVS
jgi:hypothetical protein